MRLRLAKLQKSDEEAQRIRAEGLNRYKKLDEVLYHQRLPFVPKVIWTKLISRDYKGPLAEHFGIDKTKNLVGWKYYWPSLQKDIKAYAKSCDIYLGSKAVRYKPYGDLQPLPILTHWWKDFLMDFVTGLLISTSCKGDSYDSILVIVDWLTKMVYYELIKVTIDTLGLAKVIVGKGSLTPWLSRFNRVW